MILYRHFRGRAISYMYGSLCWCLAHGQHFRGGLYDLTAMWFLSAGFTGSTGLYTVFGTGFLSAGFTGVRELYTVFGTGGA